MEIYVDVNKLINSIFFFGFSNGHHNIPPNIDQSSDK